jgi:hypothetical protein
MKLVSACLRLEIRGVKMILIIVSFNLKMDEECSGIYWRQLMFKDYCPLHSCPLRLLKLKIKGNAIDIPCRQLQPTARKNYLLMKKLSSD